MQLAENDYQCLNENVILISTGIFRDARSVLTSQKEENSDESKDAYLEEMLFLVEEGYSLVKDGLKQDQIPALGDLIMRSWEHKKKLSKLTSNKERDEFVSLGMNKEFLVQSY